MIWLFSFICHLCQSAWKHYRVLVFTAAVSAICYVCERYSNRKSDLVFFCKMSHQRGSVCKPHFCHSLLSRRLLYKVTRLPATLIDIKCSDARGVNTHRVSSHLLANWLREQCVGECTPLYFRVCVRRPFWKPNSALYRTNDVGKRCHLQGINANTQTSTRDGGVWRLHIDCLVLNPLRNLLPPFFFLLFPLSVSSLP